MHICDSNLTVINLDNGLSHEQCQTIIWTNAGMLLTWNLGTNFSEILIEIYTFSFKRMHLKMSCAKCQPFCLVLIALKWNWIIQANWVNTIAADDLAPCITKSSSAMVQTIQDHRTLFTMGIISYQHCKLIESLHIILCFLKSILHGKELMISNTFSWSETNSKWPTRSCGTSRVNSRAYQFHLV